MTVGFKVMREKGFIEIGLEDNDWTSTTLH
jgi:hypothetical protein